MIKTLKLSEKSVSKFKTFKSWKYNTAGSNDTLILEQGVNIPIFSDVTNKLSTEQIDSDFKINLKQGKNISGTFFDKDSKHFDESKEPLNQDGTYQRVVYNSIKHLFYNEYGLAGTSENDTYYKNPMHMFGSESGKYTSLEYSSDTVSSESHSREERRVIGDSITVLEIPSKIFGEKIKPGSFKIKDYSSRYESIEIQDDGNTNLTVGSTSFNEISEITMKSQSHVIDETFSTSKKLYFDYSDIAFGHSLASHDDYFISGSPVLSTSPSDMQTGHAAIYKHNSETKKFELLKSFYCPFTQSGISQELQTDNTGFLLTELGDVISTPDVFITDNFGKSVEIGQSVCAIGSPNSHITGKNNDQPTGHVFVYERNKGGVDNWGLINIFEGEPDSEFGSSISIHRDYMIVGSPELNGGTGGVYIFKKTRRTKAHPWIKTSNIYESYSWNEILKKYDGLPPQDDTKYLEHLRNREAIVSTRIQRHRTRLDILLETNEITKTQYYENLTTDDDYGQMYPYNLLYADGPDCGDVDLGDSWYKKRYWNKNTHPSVRCKEVNTEKFYTKSVWPGYITDETTGSYIPNPMHEQNKVNKWASRWKVQNVTGNDSPVGIFGEGECDPMDMESFSGDTLNSFGGVGGYPANTYTESPDSSLGDYTYDLIGMITPPSDKVLKFGEVVKIVEDKVYISNPSSNNPRCYSYVKYTNEFGCESWKLTHTLSENEITGHSLKDPNLSNELSSVSISYYDSYIEVEICPTTEDYTEWAYKLDGNLISLTDLNDTSPTLLGGIRVKKCDTACNQGTSYHFFSRFNSIGNKLAGQIPANYGSYVDISKLFVDEKENSESPLRFYGKPEMGESFYIPTKDGRESIALSWKNFRENVSFVYPNVNPGTQPSFMTIYSNNAKLDTGGYDPKYTLAEIGAQETLNGETVRLILNVGMGETEFYYDFIFKGSPQGTHFTLNELKEREDYPCTLPPNQGSYVSIADEDFEDFLNSNKAKFFTKGENQLSYTEPWSDENSIALSWKNFREDISFSYPRVSAGKQPSFMTIYSNEAKQEDGSYDPICTLAEIGAQETLEGTPVRLTFNVGDVGGDEFYYDFIFKGSPQGTHFTLNELKEREDYPCTLPPNQGSYVSIADEDFEDFLNSNKAKFFTKGENQLSYTEPWSDENSIALSWKNFREDISFSYPRVSAGKQPSFMTIYSNEAKQEDGSYDPICTLAEIGAQETLNGEVVRLVLNTGSVGGVEFYYDFIFKGSPQGTHFTLNELKMEWDDTLAELPANLGVIRRLPDSAPDDIYKSGRHPKFYSKGEHQTSYIDPWSDEDAIGLSWKNFRDNISFAYTKVPAGTMPSFMTIYSNEAKQEDGSYDPIYILAEVGAHETLNGQPVRLTMNAENRKTNKNTYYEFLFSGSPEGTHFTLSELKDETNQPPKPQTQYLITPTRGRPITPEISEKLTKIKSFGTLKHNLGSAEDVSDYIYDDFLNNKSSPKLFSNSTSNSRYQENSGLPNELTINWTDFREGVSFTYPSVQLGEFECDMTIYSDNALDSSGEYDETYILAKIGAYDTLNGQTVRLTFNTGKSDEYYYEFIYDGTSEGTQYTLSELETKISNNIETPLSVYSPERKNCKVKLEKAQISTGFHKLYLALVDADNLPIGHQSIIEFYNNPSPHDVIPRHLSVNKSYKYSYDVNSEFGRSLDASGDYLVVGNPTDRSFSPINNQIKSYDAGAAYAFATPNDSDITLLDKLYGDDEQEFMFNFKYGNSVSVLGDNFIVSGHNAECSDVNLTDSGGNKRVEIDDFIYGTERFSEDEFITTEVLITNYEYDLNSEYGNAVLKIDIDALDIDKTKLAEVEIKADFIDTGENTLRVDGGDVSGVGGLYVLRKNPISIQSGCEIKPNDKLKLFVNNDNWSIYWDTTRDRWILTDTPATTTDYTVPDYWKQIFKEFETENEIDEFALVTPQNIKQITQVYKINDNSFMDRWISRITKHDVYSASTTYLDLIILLDSKFELVIEETTIRDIFDIYRSHSLRRIDPEVETRWTSNLYNIKSILPLITELNSIEPIFINFRVLKRTLKDVYKVNDDMLMSWFDDFGYVYLTRDMLSEIRPGFYDKLTSINLNIILRVSGVTDADFIKKWRTRLDVGFLVSDVYKDITQLIDINFSISPQKSVLDLPTDFIYGIGTIDNKKISVSSDNDTIGENNFLTWGVYRNKTKIVGSRLFVYVNVLPNVDFTDSIVFVYNSTKNAINGVAYYYSVTDGKCNKIRKIKTNKNKYEARKQFGHSVTLSSSFIFVGSPVLGNFKVDELITFAGQSVVSFGNTSKLFVEHEDVHPSYLRKLENSLAGSVVVYDHMAILDTKRYYMGNVFYKNGIVSITNTDGHFSNILNNSGTNGFEVEFQSSQTLYENEILCRVEPNEFNISTNPTSIALGLIEFDINENGKFDINDLTYIFRYIMGSFVADDVDPRIEQESIRGMPVGENSSNWPTDDVVLTENEDVLLMDLFMNISTSGDFNKDYILDKLRNLYDEGVFDIDGDGATTSTDARLLLRYFMGRTGSSLTHGLVDGFGKATRFKPKEIVSYLDEKTGKNIGKQILEDFANYKENDQKDNTGSYLAPYATTIGLYSGLDLVMTAKLGKPVKILPNYPINFLIKFDS